MPSTLPEGDPVPDDGTLPSSALAEVGTRGLSIYLHVPFCRTRCGYCDFNTYTAQELGSAPGASQDTYLDAALTELRLAHQVLGERTPPVTTIFVGGGTPTLLPPAQLGRFVAEVGDLFGLVDGAEITTEANPESVDQASLAELVSYGFNRISFGMQSAVEHVLRTLDRRHSRGRPQQVARWARQEGFASVSLDLIYGTPGESPADWRTSVTAALEAEPDHLSAYSLIVEDGTRLAARIRRGELPAPDDDDLADKYQLADAMLTDAGLAAYEVSNWARAPEHECRHNLAYWLSDHWWGIGPGAHSHIGGVRFWNRKHPAAYAARLTAGLSPALGRELLDPATRRQERVMLELRLSRGVPLSVLTASEHARVSDFITRGFASTVADRLVLTPAGRLMADGVIRDLLD